MCSSANYRTHARKRSEQFNCNVLCATTVGLSHPTFVLHHLKERNEKNVSLLQFQYSTSLGLEATLVSHTTVVYWFHYIVSEYIEKRIKHEISSSSPPNHHPPPTPHSKHHSTSMGQRRT
uniref:Uncharacterized protein n=1 Tax=Ditylum brightwellii TaxID=49249 RepID=A0A7S1ZW90_9STRA|mmetsp:Transcript_3995/g.6143  ORF Transcript_3995/g.6143 Transcript_3995/m.6143 type:complete len:120 (+) Transcript_3995:2-361(+)